MRIEQIKANQLVIWGKGFRMFQSYNSVIARIDDDTGKIHLSEHWDYSRTTMKYLSKFIGGAAAQTRKKIKSGEYKLDLSLGGELIV